MNMCQANSKTITAENTTGKIVFFCCSPINPTSSSAYQNFFSCTSLIFTLAVHRNSFQLYVHNFGAGLSKSASFVPGRKMS